MLAIGKKEALILGTIVLSLLSNFAIVQVGLADDQGSIPQANAFIQGQVNVWQRQPSIETFGVTSPSPQILNPPPVILSRGPALQGSKTDLSSGCGRWLRMYHLQEISILNNLAANSIIEITINGLDLGAGDRVGKTLDLFNIPHVQIKSRDFKKALSNETRVIILDGFQVMRVGINSGLSPFLRTLN